MVREEIFLAALEAVILVDPLVEPFQEVLQVDLLGAFQEVLQADLLEAFQEVLQADLLEAFQEELQEEALLAPYPELPFPEEVLLAPSQVDRRVDLYLASQVAPYLVVLL
uniref:Uncharacterized protein n=1 Tax=Globisporangium ultimum (strain ATCC 200006 / CBS 805.95 / DAOM BR144) TaxID=431595 RepID=K3WLD1_GLOUD